MGEPAAAKPAVVQAAPVEPAAAKPAVVQAAPVIKAAEPVELVPETAPERMDSDKYQRLKSLQERVRQIPPAEDPANTLVSATSEQLAAVTQSALSSQDIKSLISPPRSANIMHLRAQLEALKAE